MNILNTCVIGNGEIILTPSINPTETTVTVKLKYGYKKLRHINILHKHPVDSQEWYSAASEKDSVYINASQINEAIKHIQNKPIQKEIQKLFLHNFTLPTTVKYPFILPTPPKSHGCLGIAQLMLTSFYRKDYNGLEKILKKTEYKITTIASTDDDLLIVALKTIKESSQKVIQKTKILWRNQTVSFDPLPCFVLGKTKKNINSFSLIREFRISELLDEHDIKNVIQVRHISRSDPTKISLIMDYCSYGNGLEYLHNCLKKKIPYFHPNPRIERLMMLSQIGKALSEMHRLNIVHCDLKLENILLKKNTDNSIQCLLSDFGLSGYVGSILSIPPGSYPPPEFLVKLETQERTQSPKGISLSTSIDAWAFGLCILEMTYGFSCYICKMGWKNSSTDIIVRRNEVVSLLIPSDPIAKIIEKLLEINPANRLSVAHATSLIDKYIKTA